MLADTIFIMINKIFSKENDQIRLTYFIDSQFASVKIEQFDTIENNLITFKQLYDFITDMQFIKWIRFSDMHTVGSGDYAIHYRDGTTVSYHITDVEKFYYRNLVNMINVNMIYYLNDNVIDDDGWIKVSNFNKKKDKQNKLKSIKKQLSLMINWTS